jgi:folate-dependent phosphoribosylglycinamide formyltransferase PurN
VRIIVLAANKYSDRALATVVALCQSGHAPAACLCVSTANFFNLARKAAQYGAGNFLKYAARRVGLLGSSKLAGVSARGLAQGLRDSRLGDDVVVLSNVDEACRHYKIELRYANDVNGERSLSWLRRLAPDLIVYTGGGILRRPLIDIPTLGVINAHSGLLPEYRGMNVTEWALLNRDEIGITVHFIDTGIDTGRILFTRRMQVTPEDVSINALRARVGCATVDALVEAVGMLERGAVAPINQVPGDSKQYFVMHEKLLEVAERKLLAAKSSADV